MTDMESTAFDFYKRLAIWCEESFTGGTQLNAVITFCGDAIVVSIGNVNVWNSDDDTTGDMSIEEAIDRYRREIRDYASPFGGLNCNPTTPAAKA